VGGFGEADGQAGGDLLCLVVGFPRAVGGVERGLETLVAGDAAGGVAAQPCQQRRQVDVGDFFGQLHPAAAAGFGGGPDRFDQFEGQGADHAHHFRHRRLVDGERRHDHLARKAAIFQPRGEQGPLDIGEVLAGVVFLALADDQLFVGEIAHHGAQLDAELADRREAAVAIGNLETTVRDGMRA